MNNKILIVSANYYKEISKNLELGAINTLKENGFEYEVIDRQLGRKGHLNGTRGHYDRSTLLDKRREFMKWWSKTLIEQGLKI